MRTSRGTSKLIYHDNLTTLESALCMQKHGKHTSLSITGSLNQRIMSEFFNIIPDDNYFHISYLCSFSLCGRVKELLQIKKPWGYSLARKKVWGAEGSTDNQPLQQSSKNGYKSYFSLIYVFNKTNNNPHHEHLKHCSSLSQHPSWTSRCRCLSGSLCFGLCTQKWQRRSRAAGAACFQSPDKLL